MPLYDYRCSNCNKIHEEIRKYEDSDYADCPHCGWVCTRELSIPALKFVGSGFYDTDYKKKSGPVDFDLESAKGKII